MLLLHPKWFDRALSATISQICQKLPKLPKWTKNGQICQKCQKYQNPQNCQKLQKWPKWPKKLCHPLHHSFQTVYLCSSPCSESFDLRSTFHLSICPFQTVRHLCLSLFNLLFLFLSKSSVCPCLCPWGFPWVVHWLSRSMTCLPSSARIRSVR